MTAVESRTAAGAADGMAPYLAPTGFIDCDDPAIVAFAREAAGGAEGARERALGIFYKVRDEVLYDPYSVEMTPAGFKASACLARGRGFCITKATLLAACLRADGIPARLGFADVRNHLSTERLRRLMGTDVFTYHGFTEVFLDGRWVKATPAFNLSLCEKFRVLPLDWDGRTDSVFHPFDADGRRHMEYVRERGSYADLPFAEIHDNFRVTYPYMFKSGEAGPGGDFHAEAASETREKETF